MLPGECVYIVPLGMGMLEGLFQYLTKLLFWTSDNAEVCGTLCIYIFELFILTIYLFISHISTNPKAAYRI